jgi:uroporphyrinogen decarboxylase
MNHPDFNRVVTAVRHRQPDRVPLVEAAISYEIMSRFLGRTVTGADLDLQVEFWEKAGYDYIALTAGMMQPGKVSRDSFISGIIEKKMLGSQELARDAEAWNLEKKAFIETEDDFQAFPWAEAAKPDLDRFRTVQRFLPEGMKIVALSGKIFTLSWLLMGYENFCVNLKLNPDFVAKLVSQVAEIQYAALCQVIDIPNVEAFWAVDDLAFGTGTILSPADFRQLIFPWYKTFARTCHEHGKLFFFHSDGLLWDILEDLIDIGIDALHPIDPTCMDIEQVKKAVGDKICLFGNIPNDLLMTGTPGEVAALTKKRIAALASGGGYCVSSGNSIPEWANLDNYKAMLAATLEFGVYAK